MQTFTHVYYNDIYYDCIINSVAGETEQFVCDFEGIDAKLSYIQNQLMDKLHVCNSTEGIRTL